MIFYVERILTIEKIIEAQSKTTLVWENICRYPYILQQTSISTSFVLYEIALFIMMPTIVFRLAIKGCISNLILETIELKLMYHFSGYNIIGLNWRNEWIKIILWNFPYFISKLQQVDVGVCLIRQVSCV